MSTEATRRAAALQVYRRFEDTYGISPTEPRERNQDGVIYFVGVTTDGREFGIGYMKDALR